MSALLLLPLLAIAGPSGAGHTEPCELFVYPVEVSGAVGKSPIITPSHIASLDLQATDPDRGTKRCSFTLTEEGASRNEAYSKSHLGQKIAIFCGSVEMARPTIAGPSSERFVVDFPSQSP
jgi:preprotein translocase subunit SecD